jgi:APA family basic amino acid/polyamine antiporter
VNLGAIVGLASVVLVLLLGQSRIFYAMAKDGMIPPIFRRECIRASKRPGAAR